MRSKAAASEHRRGKNGYADELARVDIVALIEKDVPLKLKHLKGKNGGEWCSPCPFCGGKDRFIVWSQYPSRKGRYWCRHCGKKGDALDYLRDRYGFSFMEALDYLGIPFLKRGG